MQSVKIRLFVFYAKEVFSNITDQKTEASKLIDGP